MSCEVARGFTTSTCRSRTLVSPPPDSCRLSRRAGARDAEGDWRGGLPGAGVGKAGSVTGDLSRVSQHDAVILNEPGRRMAWWVWREAAGTRAWVAPAASVGRL